MKKISNSLIFPYLPPKNSQLPDSSFEGKNGNTLPEQEKAITKSLLWRIKRLYWDIRAEQPLRSLIDIIIIKKNIKKDMKKISPNILILHHTHLLVSRCLISYCNKHNIPILVLPSYTYMYTPQGVANLSQQRRTLSATVPDAPLLNRLVAKLFPEILYEYHGQKLLFDSGYKTLLYKLMGIYCHTSPWYLGAKGNVFLAVDGTKDWYRYSENKPSNQEIVITGLPEYDISYVPNRLPLAHGGQPLSLIYAIPLLAEHQIITWDSHLQILEKVLNQLKTLPVKLQISIHPNADYKLYQEIAQRHNIGIVDKKTSISLREADIFVGTYTSTLKLALASIVPSIHLDLYNKFPQTLFDIPGVIQATSLDELTEAIMKLTNDPAFYEQTVETLKVSRANILQADGHATERLASVVMDLLEGKKPRLAGIGPDQWENYRLIGSTNHEA